MAETLEPPARARRARLEGLVWAHNSHIGDASHTEMGSVRGEHNIGQLVRERWGERAALIGFGTHTGTVTAATDWDVAAPDQARAASRADSYERCVTTAA